MYLFLFLRVGGLFSFPLIKVVGISAVALSTTIPPNISTYMYIKKPALKKKLPKWFSPASSFNPNHFPEKPAFIQIIDLHIIWRLANFLIIDSPGMKWYSEEWIKRGGGGGRGITAKKEGGEGGGSKQPKTEISD